MFIANFAKAASFFGSAREMLPSRYYTECEELAACLSRKGFAIITGGSGGIMRAANMGAKRAEGESVGININLPQEQANNPFLKHSRTMKFFFSRKVILSCASEIYIFFPRAVTALLMSSLKCSPPSRPGTANPLPIILYGKDYWNPLVQFIEQSSRGTLQNY